MDSAFKNTIQQAIQGSDAAYRELCEQIAKEVLYICIKITGNKQTGEDAAQEVLLHLKTNIRKLQHPEAFYAWLNRCIASMCAGVVRRQKSSLTLPDIPPEKQMETQTEFLPAEWAEQQEMRQTVLDSLHQLPARQRHILLMFYFEDLSTKEIAKVLKINEQAACSALYRARKSLKQRIEKRYGRQLSENARAVGVTPTLALVFHRDAALVVTEESARTLLLAAGASSASAAALGIGSHIATLVGGVAPAAVAAVLGGAVILGGPPSFSPIQPDAWNVPQPSTSQVVQVENEGAQYIESQLFPVSPASIIPETSTSHPPESTLTDEASHKSGSQPASSSQNNASTPSPSFIQIEGRVALADADGRLLQHPEMNLAGICVEARQEGAAVVYALTGPDGGYILHVPNSTAGYTLSVAQTAKPAIGPQAAEQILEPGITQAPLLLLTDQIPPSCGISFTGGNGLLNPDAALLVASDATPCTVRWQVFTTENHEAFATGDMPQINFQELGLPKGRYLLCATATDLSGNTTLAERIFYIL